MKFRITATCHLNDPFVLVSEQIEDPGTGEIRDIRRGWERWSCLVEPGSVVEISDKIIPGPYMEAVDAEGEAHIQRHIAHARPEFHNTVENLSLMAPSGPALADQASWQKEAATGSQAPVHASPVMHALKASRLPPKLPSLGR